MDGYNTYIGARYVPIIDGEWVSTKEYEPLTIVTYQGDSYTSKTYVPAGVQITDENYWVVTGNYNAQINQYRQEVTQIRDNQTALTETVTNLGTRTTNAENELKKQSERISSNSVGIADNKSAIATLDEDIAHIDTDIVDINNLLFLKGKNVHFFGDSLTFGSGGTNPYPDIFGKYTGANVVNHAISGAQATENNQPVNLHLITQINNANLNDADYVFIEIGANDYFRQSSIGTINSSTYFFMGGYRHSLEVLFTKTPSKCKVVLMTIFPNKRALNYQTEYNTLFENYNRAIIEIGKKYNLQVIDCTYSMGINTFNFDSVSADGVHFNNVGYDLIAKSLIKFLTSNNSFNDIIISGNIVGDNDFANDYSIANYFNGIPNNGIFIGLNSTNNNYFKTTGEAKYYFREGDFYTVSLDAYSTMDDPIVGVNVWNILSVRLVEDVQSPNVSIKFCEFANIEQGVNHYYKTVRCNKSGMYALQIGRNTNKEGTIGNVGVTNFSITKGFNEYIPETHTMNGIKSTDFAPNVKADSIGGIYFNGKNGNMRINGGFVTEAAITANSPILNSIPKIGTGAGINAANGILFGLDITNNSVVPFAIQGGKLVTKIQIETGHTVRLSYIIPSAY